MNELLNSAEFLVHVAVPGAVAKPGVTAGGAGDAPSWDVEGGGACVPVPARLFPFSRFFFSRFLARGVFLWSRIISIQKNTIFRI
jgi:hypothetical protein